jgi:division protein CdvB (Snf7/Vps24/ESCRT-III family)
VVRPRAVPYARAVLDDETRRIIAPRLAEFRRAAGELDASRRQLAETSAELAQHRVAGGLFGRNAKRLRDLR